MAFESADFKLTVTPAVSHNGFPLAHVPEWNRNFSKETKIFNHLSIVLGVENQALR